MLFHIPRKQKEGTSHPSKIKTLFDIEKYKEKEQDEAQDSQIVICLAYSKYPIVEAIAKADFNYKVSKSIKKPWDLFWCDRVNDFLTLVHPYWKN